MSYGDGLIAPHEVRTPRPEFELTRRGYDKRQVDIYVSRVGRELATLATERDQAFRQVRELAAQLERVQAELNELRQRPPKIDRASFQDLGPTVGQILDLAEKQARDIRTLAEERAARQKAEAEKLLAEAQQEAERLRAEGEAAYERAEQEARRLAEQGAQQLEQARAEADELLESARAQAREEIEAARAQTQQEIQARQQAIARLEAELDGAQQQLAQWRQERAAAEREVAQLQQRYDELNHELAAEMERLEMARRSAAAAERHAQQVRARVQREAERVAQLAAAAVMAAAARGTETGEYPLVVPVAPRPAVRLEDAAAVAGVRGDQVAAPQSAPPAVAAGEAAGVPAGDQSAPVEPQTAPPAPVAGQAPPDAGAPAAGGDTEPDGGGYAWFERGGGARAPEPTDGRAAGWRPADGGPAAPGQEPETGEYPLVPAQAEGNGAVAGGVPGEAAVAGGPDGVPPSGDGYAAAHAQPVIPPPRRPGTDEYASAETGPAGEDGAAAPYAAADDETAVHEAVVDDGDSDRNVDSAASPPR